MAKNTGLKTIAYELGISINTVSRALRDCDDISEQTKEIVRKKAFELGYIQSTVARFIKRDDKKTIAIIINNFENLYFSVLGNKLSEIIRDSDCDVSLICSFDSVVQEETIKQCMSQRVDAIISLVRINDKAIDCCKLNGIPVCVVGINEEPSEFCDVVCSNLDSGIYIAANYLCNLHKLKRLVYVGNRKSTNSDERYNNFVKYVNQINRGADVIKIYPDEVAARINDILEAKYWGFYCFNDETAYKAMKEMNTILPNIRKIYPRFHIVGVDALSTMVPGLIDISSIDLDLDLVAKTSINMILERLNCVNNEEKKIGKRVILPVRFHQRVIY